MWRRNCHCSHRILWFEVPVYYLNNGVVTECTCPTGTIVDTCKCTGTTTTNEAVCTGLQLVFDTSKGTADKTVSVTLGDLGIKDWGYAFNRAANLVRVPATLPAGAHNLSRMFGSAVVFNQDISGWDVSGVTNMNDMFGGASAFNSPLTWGTKTSNVLNMSSMFITVLNFSTKTSVAGMSAG